MSKKEKEEEEETVSGLGVELYREYWGRGEEISAWDAEKEHNAKKFGQTYREVHGHEREHKRCVVLCLDPGQRNAIRCPVCYGKAGTVPMDQGPEIDPIPTKGARLAAWLGGTAAAFWQGLRFPFTRDQEHYRALVIDVIQDAMEAGLTAEVDGMREILTVAKAIEGELRAIRDTVEREEKRNGQEDPASYREGASAGKGVTQDLSESRSGG